MSVNGQRTTEQTDSIVSRYAEVSQEITIISKRRSSNQIIDPKDIQKYAFELGNFHFVDLKQIATHFETDLQIGITPAQVKKRLARDGPNIVNPPKDYPLWVKFFFCFLSGFAPLLWVATALVFISWEPFGTPPSNIYNLILALVLIAVIVVSSIFTFIQEVMASQILEKFKNLIPLTAIVLRDGKVLSIKAADLVMGDLVILYSGSKIPADIRITESKGLKVDKSMFTGESEPVKISTDKIIDPNMTYLSSPNVVFMGTNIVEGEGRGIVISTGAHTQLNKIMEGALHATGETSLQKDIDRLVLIIGSFALITGTVVILEWAFYLRVQHNSFMTVSSMIANAISVVVAYVPEGLPLALSMGLTIIARRLCAQHNVLVKRLATIETVGSMSFLGSDKTGTLTQNKMAVTSFVSGLNQEKIFDEEYIQKKLSDFLFNARRVATLCNQAKLQVFEETSTNPVTAVNDEESGIQMVQTTPRRVPIGSNATDQALLAWAAESSDIDALLAEYIVLCSVPFSSLTKMSSVVVQNIKTKERYILVKGAPEYILQSSTHYFDGELNVQAISEAFVHRITELMNVEACQGRRMVATAQFGPLKESEFPADFKFVVDPYPNFPLDKFTFIGAIAVTDPPKEGVKEAIESLREAGILVSMITGDATITAIAIAREVGVITFDSGIPDNLENLNADNVDKIMNSSMSRKRFSILYQAEEGKEEDQLISKKVRNAVKSTAIVVSGYELDTITEEQWDYIFQHKEFIFARTTPEHKLMIVKEAQRRGHRVGVTGDGINDSPALKNADVGIAMKDGAEVARDAAAIILLDNNFASIVHAVCEGRLIFVNLRRVIGYQMSAGCWGELLPVLATFFLGLPQPLSSFLMIIISCVSDVFAGIALMSEPPENDIMKQPPRDIRKAHLLDYKLVLYSYMFYANLNSIGSFYTYFLYMAERGDTRALPNPLPADDGYGAYDTNLPAGYRADQLIGAWNWGSPSGPLSDDESSAANVGSSVFYVCIVVTQMGHVLSVRRKIPYFYDAIMNTKGEQDNVLVRMWNELINSEVRWPIVYAWIGAIAATNFFNYVPVFQEYCGTAAVPGRYWGIAIGWSVLWFTIAEIRKWLVKLFPDSIVAQLDW